MRARQRTSYRLEVGEKVTVLVAVAFSASSGMDLPARAWVKRTTPHAVCLRLVRQRRDQWVPRRLVRWVHQGWDYRQAYNTHCGFPYP